MNITPPRKSESGQQVRTSPVAVARIDALVLRLLLTLFFAFGPSSSTIEAQLLCAEDSLQRVRIMGIPDFELKQRKDRLDLYKYIEQKKFLGGGTLPQQDYWIPVVFHVIHAGEPLGTGSNIAYFRLQDQIAALNEDFSGNSGGPSPGADSKIRFCLAQNPSPGTSWSNPLEPGVMRYNNPALNDLTLFALGYEGDDLIAFTHSTPGYFPSTNYLNVWIVDAIVNDSGTEGAYGAWINNATNAACGNSEISGAVVIHHSITADDAVYTGNYPAFNSGTVLSHEIGHGLSLLHTFQQDGGPGAFDADCATSGDWVCDTPPCEWLSPDCVSGTLNTVAIPNEFITYALLDPNPYRVDAFMGIDAFDLIENYINSALTDDECAFTWTSGQIERMIAELEMNQTEIWSAQNLINTGVVGSCIANLLTARFESDPLGCTNDALTFSNPTGAGLSAVAWSWDFGDGSTALGTPTVNHAFTQPGEYLVELTVGDGVNNATWSKIVVVLDCHTIDQSEANWIYGNYVGLDFSTGLPKVVNHAMSPPTMAANEATIAVSDETTGALLFYSNGIFAWKADGSLIPGDPLGALFTAEDVPPLFNYEMNTNRYWACVPFPAHPGEYYLVLPPDQTNSGTGVVKLAHIDLNAGGGTGLITVSDLPNGQCDGGVPQPCSDFIGEPVFVVPHCNGIDYWVIMLTRSINSGGNVYQFLVYHLSEHGWSNPDFTKTEWLGNLDPSHTVISGISTIHMATMYGGTMLLYNPGTSVLKHYDFDNATGQIQLQNTLTISPAPNQPGVALTADEQYLYYTSSGAIRRFNLGSGTSEIIGDEVVSFDQYVSFARGPEAISTDKRMYYIRQCTDELFVMDQPTDPVAGNVMIYKAADYSDAGFPLMLNQSGLTDFLDGDKIPEVPLEITSTETECGIWHFEIPECYENWTISWSFGDGTFDYSDQISVLHAFLDDIGYGVTVTATMNGLYPQYASVSINGCEVFSASSLPVGTTTWANIDCMYVQASIEVPAGSNLIVDQSTIKFDSDARLIIKPGGTVTLINGAILTSCHETWLGIHLQTQNGPQTASNQPTLFMTDSEVSNAVAAIYVCSLDNASANSIVLWNAAGRVFVDKSTFLNNRADIFFDSWNNQTDNESYVRGSRFLLDSSYPAYTSFYNTWTNGRININYNNRIDLISNTFINLNTDLLLATELLAIGGLGYLYLTTDEANYPTADYPPVITNFTRGVFWQVDGSSISTCFVNNYEFRCLRSVYSSGQRLNLSNNTFLDMEPGYWNQSMVVQNSESSGATGEWSYAAYLKNAIVIICKNNFVDIANPDIDYRQGFIVKDHGSNNASINQNEFHHSHCAIEARGTNKNLNGTPGSTGLSAECNEFFDGEDSPVIPGNNAHDVLVTSGFNCGGPCPPGLYALFGMRQSQGSSANSAGNLFQPSPAGTDFEAEPGFVSDGYLHSYWHFPPNNELNPPFSSYVINATNPAVTVSTQPHPLCDYDANDFMGMMEQFQSELDQKETERQQVVDGGDTQELTQLLIDTDYSEALTTYYELLELSPNLSRQVLMEALASYELPNVLLTEILSSNPTAAKDPGIREQINNRLVPFDEYQKQLIAQGMYWLSYKEEIESRIAQLHGWVDYATNLQLDEIWQAEDAPAAKAEAVLTLLAGNSEPQRMYEKAEAIKIMEGTSAAMDYIATIETQNALDQYGLDEMNDVLYVYGLYEMLESGQLPDLSSGQEAALRTISARHSAYATNLASGLLYLFHKEQPMDELYIPETENRMTGLQQGADEITHNFSIYPNPAQNFVTLQRQTALDEQINIEVLDLAGRVLTSSQWMGESKQVLLDVRTLAAGAYHVRISNSESVLQTIQIVLNK